MEELEDSLKIVEEVHNSQVKETCKCREKNKELEEKLKLVDDAEKKKKSFRRKYYVKEGID